ncbi:MAG: GtrA family protein [Patescibacteria group bacterium]|nr:GtrA family protein [Patescibacteria group bacterium]
MPLINRFYDYFRRFFAGRFPKIFAFCDRRKAIVKFFIAGAFAGTVDLVALFIFHGLLAWDIVLSTSLAFLFSFLVSFSLQKLWTFRNYSQKRLPHQLFLYFGAAFISMNLNGLGMHILVNNLHIWYLLSQILVNIVLGIINFFTYKFIVFRKTNEDENQN